MSEQPETNFRCLACNRNIVNRAVDRCLYCGESIPQELQFTQEEIQQNEDTYKEKVRKAEERRKKARQTGGDGMAGPLDSGGGDW